MIESVQRIRLIATNTFLEAVRQKFFSAILLISVGLIIFASFFQQFDFGTNELKFIIDFGFGAIFFFGSILSIAISFFVAQADKTMHAVNTKSVFLKILLNFIKLLLATNYKYLFFHN